MGNIVIQDNPSTEELQLIFKLAPRRYLEYEEQIFKDIDLLVDYIISLDSITPLFKRLDGNFVITHTAADNDTLHSKVKNNLGLALYHYAINILYGRWPAAESHIMASAEYSYYYAYHIIRGRWLEAEPIILSPEVSAPRWAFYYAVNILTTRWPEAETFIRSDPYIETMYASCFDSYRYAFEDYDDMDIT